MSEHEEAEGHPSGPGCVRFVVDETPYACWEWSGRERSLGFLRGVDPSYYTYVADANAEYLDDEEHQHQAALAIRIAYSQALETLFALIGSYLQAPGCVFGWLLKYRVAELTSLVRKIASGEKILHGWSFDPTWENISREVHWSPRHDDAKREWITAGFAKAWRKFACDFLNESSSTEYNSAKHGLRTRLGGFSVRIGAEETPGQPVSPDKMKPLGGSTFGTSFHKIEPLGSNLNFCAPRLWRNWFPENLINGIHLLSMSIGNVASALLILNGEKPEECMFENPESPEMFDTPWAQSCVVNDWQVDSVLAVEDIAPCSKKEILGSYDRSDPAD